MGRKFYALAIAALFSMSALTASAADYLTVIDADGNKTNFAIADYPKISFTSSAMVITDGSRTVEYPLTEYRSFAFTDKENNTDGVEKINADGTNAKFSFADGIHGEGLEAGTRVVVYSINGQVVGQGVVSAGGSVDVPLQGNGVYIVKSAKKSFKFIRK